MDDVKCYRCDPKKNVVCQKTLCQTECFYTVYEQYAVREEKENDQLESKN